MKLTGYGKREWFGGGIIASLLIGLSVYCTRWEPVTFTALAGVIGLVYLCVLAFFRDPDRKIPGDSNILVSPADGVVHDIELLKNVEENQFFEGKDTIRIGIFLSLLNVHINRIPCDMEVKEKKYREGFYHDARTALASKENEAMTLFCSALVDGKAFPMIIRQISGATAKRIVCKAETGQKYNKGERFGMIKFGSRTELFLPAEPWMELTVKLGDKLKAGETVVAKVLEKDRNNNA